MHVKIFGLLVLAMLALAGCQPAKPAAAAGESTAGESTAAGAGFTLNFALRADEVDLERAGEGR